VIDKNCDNCLYRDDENCFERVGGCDDFEACLECHPNQKEDDPFNSQVGGSHYKKTKDCPDVAEWCMKQKIEFGESCVIKYVFRHERKNGFEDLEKAIQYLRFIAWVKYNKTLK